MSQGKRPRNDAAPVVYRIQRIVSSLPFVERLEVTGSWRRLKPEIGDIDVIILVTSCDASSAFSQIIGELKPSCVVRRGRQKLDCIVSGWSVNFWQCREVAHWGAFGLFTTGNGEFNIAMRAYAKKCGLTLNQYGLKKPTGEYLDTPTEESIFRWFNMPVVPPQNRTGFDAFYEARERWRQR